MARNGASRMKKPCDCCKRYLDHLDGKNQSMSCFLRHMTANFKHSMVMPNRFLKKFAIKLSGTIKLVSPNGSVYDVEVTKRFNKVVLRHGWGDFVDAHYIEENNFLLFRHVENSTFEVLILDSDGCEKVFSCAGIKNTRSVQDKIVDSVYISRSSFHDTTESSASERLVRSEKGGSSHREKPAKIVATSSSSESSGEDSLSEYESFWSDDLQTNPGPDYVLSRGSYLSGAQEERVMALLQEIQPESTVYIAVMRKCHIVKPGPYLAIPKAYAAHFLHDRTNVTLQRPGKSKKWHPRFYQRKDKRMYMLRGQWLDFVRDNHVQVEDICILVPAEVGRRFMFTVYLLRATATHSRGGTSFQRVGPFHGRSSTKMASTVHTKEESSDDNVSSQSDMDEASHKYLKSNSGGPSEAPYIVSSKSCLSRSQKKIVEEKVRAIQSEVPIYVAIMKKMNADVTYRYHIMELGIRFAAPHLPHRGQTVLLQCMKKVWETKMVVRSGTRRWFLMGGWATFVRDNGLRVGDICLFELKKKGELTMKVHIISREQF
ncbi:B3 domain-containing protein Os03g0619600-like isoform X1 [Panicum virgatum]|nr:B3 domain-containing protein Os03g0619600-like isoform X1 [Panicum virgatum]XP_039783395.1 B3 domain-containing protein Os03g0619600-like isoform X1 [Panicum virgatum]XP_039783396.1 B3 domain-containing protein Os03g0619600-like isoform X1 [Panicum virgatum]XP_039783397.1 B3 domain-containing protein Os03g0619600-like isoform X1 [Panicum virgatum]XP_039783398.1 B3 domain-containing protein Os03g0619600-like isoform X1 [Panicum virgatum]